MHVMKFLAAKKFKRSRKLEYNIEQCCYFNV